MLNKILIALYLCFFAYPLSAQEDPWIRVTEDVNGTLYLIRLSDFTNNLNSKPRVWIKADASKDKTVIWREGRSLIQFDCNEMSYYYVQVTLYRPDKSILTSYQGSEFDKEFVVPDSISETLLYAACPKN